MTDKPNKFYLAGRYDLRPEYQWMAQKICEATGWTCTARWLSGRHDDLPLQQAAEEDVEDLRSADALVIVNDESTRGGMWVEMGMALAWKKPVVLLVDGEGIELRVDVRPEPAVFAWLPQVTWLETVDAVCQFLTALDAKDAYERSNGNR